MKYLCLDFFIGIVCTIFEKDSYFLELNIIFLIVVITMLIGKCRNHLKNVCKSYVPGKGLWQLGQCGIMGRFEQYHNSIWLGNISGFQRYISSYNDV